MLHQVHRLVANFASQLFGFTVFLFYSEFIRVFFVVVGKSCLLQLDEGHQCVIKSS